MEKNIMTHLIKTKQNKNSIILIVTLSTLYLINVKTNKFTYILKLFTEKEKNIKSFVY